MPQGMAAFVVMVLSRVGVGSLVAAVMAADGQEAGPMTAFGLGVAAPLMIQRMAPFVPVNADGPATPQPTPAGKAGQVAAGGSMLTILRDAHHLGLNVPPTLARTVRSTNPIE